MSDVMDVQGRLLDLAKKLRDRTRAGHIDWVTTPHSSEVTASGPNSGFTLRSMIDSDGDEVVTLALLNPRGQRVASLECEWSGGEEAPQNEVLRELYDLAKRKALKIDELIESTLHDLDQGDFGPSELPF
ncbi:hypothetical protein GCM10010123_44180 [Pilimelia anulata]|uniref:Uncharacterized protein n=1 Tax=Pilimelia anulata TaxID=53371 RepID=A0A8J3BEN7_9ACTN|nr:hypothetical protein [Pilimelia anulata]GGK09455.1 hypothetical protein GCM10010123_44180 [Pilimelia anulata]